MAVFWFWDNLPEEKKIEELKRMHTKQLLKFLDVFRRPSWHVRYWTEEEVRRCQAEEKLIKAELATREHVPSRPENKVARQKAAKEHRRRNKLTERRRNK